MWRRGNTHQRPAFFGMSEARWKVHRAADDAPPPWFSELKHFKGPTGDWTPREEVDFMLWVYLETGMTYDEAVVEVKAVTTVFQELRDVEAAAIADPREIPHLPRRMDGMGRNSMSLDEGYLQAS